MASISPFRRKTLVASSYRLGVLSGRQGVPSGPVGRLRGRMGRQRRTYPSFSLHRGLESSSMPSFLRQATASRAVDIVIVTRQAVWKYPRFPRQEFRLVQVIFRSLEMMPCSVGGLYQGGPNMRAGVNALRGPLGPGHAPQPHASGGGEWPGEEVQSGEAE